MMCNKLLCKGILTFFVLILLSGCSSMGGGHPSDPLESVNRKIDVFNQKFDKAVAKPVARGYRKVVPDPLDKGITNFFRNLADVPSAANNLFQLKPLRALNDVGRVCINTTVGLLGLFDVASVMGMPSYKEDFGQTLGYWGVGDSPYLVIPFLGPSNARDFGGGLVNGYFNPVNYASGNARVSLVLLNAVDRRADMLEAGDFVDEAAVDRYSFVREAYLQRRRSAINDGQVPLDEEVLDESQFMDEPSSESPQE